MPKDTKSNQKRFLVAIVLLFLVSLLHSYLRTSSDADMPAVEANILQQENTAPIPENEEYLISEGLMTQMEPANPPAYLDAALGGIRIAEKLVSVIIEIYEEPEPLQDYVLAEADAVAMRIISHGEGNIIFPFLSDGHCGYYTDKDNKAVALAGQLLNQIGKQVHYSFVANGGDMSTGAWNTTREHTFSHAETYAELVRIYDENIPQVWAMGNHDDAPYRETLNRLTQADTYCLVGERNSLSGVQGPEGGNYGYLDIYDIQLRVIVLDTDDKRDLGSAEVGAGEPGPDYLNAHNIGVDQLRWLADTALDFSKMEHPQDWSVVVISHVALNVSGKVTDVDSGEIRDYSTAHAANILTAYRNGDSYRVKHNDEIFSCDFSEVSQRAEIICAVHGHEHRFSDEMVSGILSIGCPNMMNGRERKSDDGKIYSKTPDSGDGTSFCIITIDRESRRIYADCAGAGYDREFSY